MPKKDIVIHAVPEEEIEFPLYNVHSHGMEKFGYPNLVIFCSGGLIYEAAKLINIIQSWIASGPKLINPGDLENHRLNIDGYPPVKFLPVENFGESCMVVDTQFECSLCLSKNDVEPKDVEFPEVRKLTLLKSTEKEKN